MNTIPIQSWSGGVEDKELLKLIPYMEKLSAAVRLSHPHTPYLFHLPAHTHTHTNAHLHYYVINV